MKESMVAGEELTAIEEGSHHDDTEEKVELDVARVFVPFQPVPCIWAVKRAVVQSLVFHCRLTGSFLLTCCANRLANWVAF